MKVILNKLEKNTAKEEATIEKVKKYGTRILVLYLFSVTFKSFDTSFSNDFMAVTERGQWFSAIFVGFGLLAWELGIGIVRYIESRVKGRNLQISLIFMGMVLVLYGGLVSLIFGILYSSFDHYFFDAAILWEGIGFVDYDLNAGLFVFYLLILTFAGLNYYHKSWYQSQLQGERLKKENIQAKFDALRHQIDPHFFFNSLSVLTNLVYKDAELSANYINHLAKMYRYILDKKFQNIVPLSAELEFVEAYIFLINIRHQRNIHITISLSEKFCRTGYLPPATLQILVENAIKHNCFTRESPLEIQIMEVENGICVVNNLNIRKLLQDSTGLGLENIQNRYALLSNASIRITKTEKTFEVFVPIIHSAS